eukprot:gene11835-15837_t
MAKFIEPLGKSIPEDSKYSVSVSLPLWNHVIGYEEGDQAILNQLTSGYPRFRFPNDVTTLMAMMLDWRKSLVGSLDTSLEMACLLFPNEAVARRFVTYMNYPTISELIYTASFTETIDPNNLKKSHFIIKIDFEKIDQIYVAFFPASSRAKAKSYWQHTGEIVNGRLANSILDIISSIPFPNWKDCLLVSATEEKLLKLEYSNESYQQKLNIIKNRIKYLVLNDQHNDLDLNITITVSGMCAIFTALRVALLYDRIFLSNGNSSLLPHVVVFGFPYLDTLKMMERVELNPGGAIFLGNGDEKDLDRLEELLNSDSLRICALFTEFPSNPLLACVDLQRLTSLSHRFGFLLVVDDTIASFANVDLFESDGVRVDILCSSLTKVFNGYGDLMAGSMIINPFTSQLDSLYVERTIILNQIVNKMKIENDIPMLSNMDLLLLEENSREYLKRLHQTNKNANNLAKYLCSKSDYIDYVYYPSTRMIANKIVDNENNHVIMYDVVKRKSNQIIKMVEESSVDSSEEWFVPGYGCLLSFVLKPNYNTQLLYNSLEVSKGPSLGTNFTLTCPYTLLAHYNELEWAASYGIASNLLRVSVGIENIE